MCILFFALIETVQRLFHCIKQTNLKELNTNVINEGLIMIFEMSSNKGEMNSDAPQVLFTNTWPLFMTCSYKAIQKTSSCHKLEMNVFYEPVL